jgi:predicted nucleotidyltransferase component of viral defense system
MSKKIVDIPASVRARLLTLARGAGTEFQSVLVRYALERLMYRLSISELGRQFVLKGALLFEIWTADRLRATQDVDFLHLGMADPMELKEIFQSICAVDVEGDGLRFAPETVEVAEIREDQAHGGTRVTLKAWLGKAVIPLQIDVGLGDVVFPAPVESDFPTLLDQPAPHLAAYARETAIAEKFEAMVRLDLPNSRMKDFFDLWVLCQRFSFSGDILQSAIEETFKRRKTPIPTTLPTALTARFSEDRAKQVQWRAFTTRGRLAVTPPDLTTVIECIAGFIAPVIEAARNQRRLTAYWEPPGPWSDL